jgi:hypothetical protein
VDATAVPAAPGALRAVSHKLHATCGANQVPVAALARLMASGIRVDDIVRIDVHLSQASFDYPGCEDHGPFREGATFLSRPFALAATAIAGGGPLGEAQTRAALRDPRLDGLARRVRAHVVPDAELAGPQDAWVEVLLADATVRRAGADDLDARELQPDWPAIADRLRAGRPELGSRLITALERMPAGEIADLTAPLRTAHHGSEST